MYSNLEILTVFCLFVLTFNTSETLMYKDSCDTAIYYGDSLQYSKTYSILSAAYMHGSKAYSKGSSWRTFWQGQVRLPYLTSSLPIILMIPVSLPTDIHINADKRCTAASLLLTGSSRSSLSPGVGTALPPLISLPPHCTGLTPLSAWLTPIVPAGVYTLWKSTPIFLLATLTHKTSAWLPPWMTGSFFQ